MKLTKQKLKQIIREEFKGLKEESDPDIMQQDQLGAAAVLPGRIQAAQSALDSLRRALNPPSPETKVAIGALVKALNDQGYTVQFPASSIRDVGGIEPTE